MKDLLEMHRTAPFPIFFVSWIEIVTWLDDRGLNYDADTIFTLNNDYETYRKKSNQNCLNIL